MGLFSKIKKGLKRAGSKLKEGAKKVGSKLKITIGKVVGAGLSGLHAAGDLIKKGRTLVTGVISKVKGTVLGSIVIDLLEDTPIGKLIEKGDEMAKSIEHVIEKSIAVLNNVDKLKDISSVADVVDVAKSSYSKLNGEAKQRVDQFVKNLMDKHPKASMIGKAAVAS